MTDSLAMAPPARAESAAQKQLVLWGWISFGALAVAGVFALLLALSRIPGLGAAFPVDFFYKGLVIHVIFSLVVWLLANLGYHMSAAASDLADGAPRGIVLGRIGQTLTLAAFPCLFAPAFFSSAQAQLTNYIPLIDHPVYDLGLALLALGLLATAAQMFANLPGHKIFALSAETFGAAAMGWIYGLVLLTFGIAAFVLLRRGDLVNSREQFNWGGGHLLQFAYAALLLTNWAVLARDVFGDKVFNPGLFRLALGLIALFVLPSLAFHFLFDAFSEQLHDAYRLLKFAIGIPALALGANLLIGARANKSWNWRDPALVALALSVVLFAVGGLMGLAISGSDTRTPAHYHAVITAVSLSCMGLWLSSGFARVDRAPVPEKWARLFLLLYGGGQLLASLGMFVAGGYGAQRKTPEAVGHLAHVAASGMAVHGVGALLAVCGGAGVVILALRALFFSRRAS